MEDKTMLYELYIHIYLQNLELIQIMHAICNKTNMTHDWSSTT